MTAGRNITRSPMPKTYIVTEDGLIELTIDPLMARTKVQTNLRLTYGIRLKLEAYLTWRQDPEVQKLLPAKNITKPKDGNHLDPAYWPDTITEVIEQALDNWLSEHPLKLRAGKGPAPRPAPVRAAPKQKPPVTE